MKRKILSVLTIIALSLSVFVFPTTTVSATTTTETCTLPMDRHTLQHTFPPCPQQGDSLRTDTCSVCGIATRTAGMESFHPEGAPDGITATRYVCYYNKMDQGVASEKCSMSECTETGPHGICACGQIASVGQSHKRTYDKTGIGFTKLTPRHGGVELDVHEGDIISVSSSTNSSDVPVTMTLDGEVVVESDDYLGKYYTVEHDGHMVLKGRYSNAQFYYLSPMDSNGTKYNLPLVYGGFHFYADQLEHNAQYSDGIYMHGSDKLSSSFTRLHCRFMTHIPANTIVTMECKSDSFKDATARLCILDSAKKVVYSRSKSDAYTGTVIAVTVKEEGDYWVLPEYYWTYVDEEYNSISTQPNGMVTVRFNGLVSPAQKEQSISASLSSAKVGYGSIPPVLTVNGAQTNLSYTSSNPAVAAISNTGVIEIKGVGSTIFTVSAEETNAWKAAQNTVTLTVSKGNLSISVKPTAGSINYGQQLSVSNLSGGKAINASGSSVGGGWSYKSPSTYPNAGTTAYTIRFIPTDTTHYNY